MTSYHALIDLHHRLLKYNDSEVYIAFDKNDKPWFYAKQLAAFLGYKKIHQAISNNIPKEHIKQLQNIDENFKDLYKNVQGHTNFVDETGLNLLIMKSKKKIAVEIVYWIANEVMPALKEYGKYEENDKIKKQLKELKNEYDKAKKQIKVLEHDMQTTKYKKDGAIYVMRVLQDDTNLEYDTNEIIDIKFGHTTNMNKRKYNYESCIKHKIQILNIIYVDDPKTIERCVMNKIDKFKVRKQKEYYTCSYNEIMKVIAKCIRFFENRVIDIQPMKYNENKRINNENMFDQNKVANIYILNDDADVCNSDEEIIQNGGNDIYYTKYLKYKIKYLELCVT